MDAIELIEEQHREVEDLFEEFESAKGAAKRRIFEQIADKLAVHATLEEKHFYPAIKERQTEDLLREAVEEHLSAKRLIADALALEEDDEETLEAKVKVLQEQIEHHVEEEEEEMLPAARKILGDDLLQALAQEMVATQEELLAKGSPRNMVPGETEQAAPI